MIWAQRGSRSPGPASDPHDERIWAAGRQRVEDLVDRGGVITTEVALGARADLVDRLRPAQDQHRENAELGRGEAPPLVGDMAVADGASSVGGVHEAHEPHRLQRHQRVSTVRSS